MDKDIEVPAERFRRLHVGDSLKFEMSRGMFGIPVVTDRFADKKLKRNG